MGKTAKVPRGEQGRQTGRRNFQRCDPGHKLTPSPAVCRPCVLILKCISWLVLNVNVKDKVLSLTATRNEVILNALMLCGRLKCGFNLYYLL